MRKSVEGISIGVLCGIILTGCAGNTSPISPSAVRPALGGSATASTSLDVVISQRATDSISTLIQGQGAENRWVECYPGVGGYEQISVHAEGMAGAIRI